ncbi:MAG: hypothetical protein ABSD49_06250 [Candidatus Bathyarchaeia archaeon]|jgi:hypothetical protein
MTEKEYHDLWYIQLKEPTLLIWLEFLKTASIQQIEDQVRKIERHEWSTNHFAIEWESFIANEHMQRFIEDPTKKLLEIREILQPIRKLLFPKWIMDRYKEALDQYVRGEWMSSILLCGDIVEFIVYEFWTAYAEDIPRDMRKTPSDGTQKNLKTLLDYKIIDNVDHARLLHIRQTRDRHAHYRLRERMLIEYSRHLKSDSAEVLRKLAEFFTIENMESKYSKYLEYAMKEETQATSA